jgi:predicted 2-oxoglutarate/Fe(II)-dependent dioxygenase YbiX
MKDILVNLFTKEECDAIILYASNYQKNRQKIIPGRNTAFEAYYMTPNNDNEWVFQRMYDFLENELGVKVTHSLDKIMINNYKINDSFDKHQDLYFKNQIYNVAVNLNENYEGGEFELFEPHFLIEKKAGNACIFENTRWHGVKPILNGERWSMIAFFLKDNIDKNKKLI